MTDPLNMTDPELSYVMTDAAQAIAAYPEGANVRRYIGEISDCEKEMTRRMDEEYAKDRKKTLARMEWRKNNPGQLIPIALKD